MKFNVVFWVVIFLSARSWSRPLKVLTYESMQGKGSLGEYIQKEFRSACKDCVVEFITTRENAGLLGKLRSDKRRGRSGTYDLVLGLDFYLYRAALGEKLVKVGKLVDKSPFAIMVDTNKIAKSSWPKSWKELSTQFAGKILIEDPRLSQTGVGWLRSIFEMHALDLGGAKALTARVFPSWSAAYAAFTAGEGSAVWSYVTSEAYHRCEAQKLQSQVLQNEKKANGRIPRPADPRYLAMPLDEGYPVQEEWIAPIAGAQHPALDTFLNFIVSRKVQEQIPLTNWMFPAVADIPLPDCYKGLTEIKSWNPEKALQLKDLRAWTDQWSL